MPRTMAIMIQVVSLFAFMVPLEVAPDRGPSDGVSGCVPGWSRRASRPASPRCGERCWPGEHLRPQDLVELLSGQQALAKHDLVHTAARGMRLLRHGSRVGISDVGV